MLGLLVILIILAIVVIFIAKPVLAALGAPPWAFTVVTGLVLIIAIYLIAQAFGISVPALK